MSRCIDSDTEYEVSDEQSPANERGFLLGQNVNLQMRRSGVSEREATHSLMEHALPLGHDEEGAVGQHSSTSETLFHGEVGDRLHCHAPATSDDRVAVYQLIAISVLCFVFMVAEVIGEFLWQMLFIRVRARVKFRGP